MDTNHFQSRWKREERGTTIVLVVVAMVALLGFAALSVDISHLYQQQRDIQSATDAASLAASALITNPTPADSVIIQEAVNLAAANGISASEISASSISNSGTVQLGEWDGSSFTAGTKPYNAVRVPAKRTVNLFFGPVVGLKKKVTAVHSVAINGNKTDSFGGNGYGSISFGLDLSMLDQPLGSIVTIDKSNSGGGAGNFGQLDFSSLNKNNSWSDNMYPGCNCTLAIGDQVGTIPGKNGGCPECTDTGFSERLASNPYAIMPVIGNWPNGNSGNATIVGFVGVKIISVTGPGNWSVTFQIVPIGVGGGTNGVPITTAFGPRELVQ
jgi:Flp pilus assembly protein TadG